MKKLTFKLWQKIVLTIYELYNTEAKDIYITRIARKLNTSYDVLRPYINLLEDRGLIKKYRKGTKAIIRLTQEGNNVALGLINMGDVNEKFH